MEGNAAGKRESWMGRFGIILAVAGSAVGLGNFLRFPTVAAQNGGGAFMIPYFIAFLFLGLPVCWVEWALGRYGGKFSHGSAPGIFDAVSGHKPWAKYLGILGIIGPLGILFFYIYVESWTLAYSVFAVTGKYKALGEPAQIKAFFGNFLGGEGPYFSGIGTAYIFFLVTFVVNFAVIYRGISKGIEAFCEWAMPLLFIAGIALMVRVLTLGAPLADHPDWNIRNGLGFLWNPDFSSLGKPSVWLAAAGQIFFTLSVGIGVILTYASYVKSKQDISLSSTTASAMNEVAEVILGGSIVIPAAVCFFGMAGAREQVAGGTFGLGFRTMPLIFNRLPAGEVFGFYWFILLFVAGITSSISLLQPAISFLEEELGLSRKQSVVAVGAVCFVVSHLVIFEGVVIDEMDLWFSTFGLPLFGLIELLIFVFVFGVDRGWQELHEGGHIRIPIVFKYVVKYVTPVFLGGILVAWLVTDGWRKIAMINNDGTMLYEGNAMIWALVVRVMYLALIIGTGLLIRRAWRRKALLRAGTEGGLR